VADPTEAAITAWAATLTRSTVTDEVPVGTYRGLTILVRLHSMAQPQVVIRGETQRDAPLDKRYGLGRSLVRTVHAELERYPLYERALVHDIDKLERTLTRYGVAAQDQPYPHEAYATALTGLLRELQTALRERPTAPAEGDTPLPEPRDAASVVADIDALKAAQAGSKDATPVEAVVPVSMAASIHELIAARHAAE
jgi:hypothetical protein